MCAQERKFQPPSCKKCGDSGFYYPDPYDETKFDKVDKFGNVVAFDPKYNTPHWYVCPSNPKGLENRRKIEDSRKVGSGQSTIEKSLDAVPKSDPPNRLTAGGPLTEERLQNLEAELKEINRMLTILVQRTEPVG